MIIKDAGHTYILSSLDGDLPQELSFVKRFREKDNHPGTTNQEVLRVLIDRVIFLDKELPHVVNEQILKHLRMALVLHEARALTRKVEKDELLPEHVEGSSIDGHFILKHPSEAWRR